MGEVHDRQAAACCDSILAKIRSEDADFKQIFTRSIVRSGDWDWPRPDYVCFDESLKATYAFEFKPLFQSKREYLTGFGQAMAYLQNHTYSALVVPERADDGFPIATFIADVLSDDEFKDISTSLFSYSEDLSRINILHKIKKPRVVRRAGRAAPAEVKTFWCWWRDESQYELFDILNLSFIYGDKAKDAYTKLIYPAFCDLERKGLTKQWDGTPRKKKLTPQTISSEKQNYRIPLEQLGLMTREGQLTGLGFRLLSVGKKYGPDSSMFLDTLAYLLLIPGRHLDLINLVSKFQKTNSVSMKSGEYAIQLENHLTAGGYIGKRKPTAVTTGAKNSYIRDEPKLWNKFRLLATTGSKNFIPGKGYDFDWERITSILTNCRDFDLNP